MGEAGSSTPPPGLFARLRGQLSLSRAQATFGLIRRAAVVEVLTLKDALVTSLSTTDPGGARYALKEGRFHLGQHAAASPSGVPGSQPRRSRRSQFDSIAASRRHAVTPRRLRRHRLDVPAPVES